MEAWVVEAFEAMQGRAEPEEAGEGRGTTDFPFRLRLTDSEVIEEEKEVTEAAKEGVKEEVEAEVEEGVEEE